MEKGPETPPKKRSLIGSILFLPFGCLLNASPLVLLGVLLVAGLGAAFIYFNVNVDWFGLGKPDFSHLKFNGDFTRVDGASGDYWIIYYEKSSDSTFTGLVRFASPGRESMIPFYTHDILVTSGDFADPAKVTTSVMDHHFTWVSPGNASPKGAINLLHIIPVDEATWRKLLGVQKGKQVSISGREILRIEEYHAGGVYAGKWEDAGCNSILVKSVEITQ